MCKVILKSSTLSLETLIGSIFGGSLSSGQTPLERRSRSCCGGSGAEAPVAGESFSYSGASYSSLGLEMPFAVLVMDNPNSLKINKEYCHQILSFVACR